MMQANNNKCVLQYVQRMKYQVIIQVFAIQHFNAQKPIYKNLKLIKVEVYNLFYIVKVII